MDNEVRIVIEPDKYNRLDTCHICKEKTKENIVRPCECGIPVHATCIRNQENEEYKTHCPECEHEYNTTTRIVRVIPKDKQNYDRFCVILSYILGIIVFFIYLAGASEFWLYVINEKTVPLSILIQNGIVLFTSCAYASNRDHIIHQERAGCDLSHLIHFNILFLCSLINFIVQCIYKTNDILFIYFIVKFIIYTTIWICYTAYHVHNYFETRINHLIEYEVVEYHDI